MRKVRGVFKKLKFLLVAPLVASCTVTPEPFTAEEIKLITKSDRELIFSSQESLHDGAPFTLEKAFAMALKYNLENRVLLLEETLANESFDIAEFAMLPSLAANAGYTDRSNLNASFSNSVATGQQSLVPSSSQELQQTNAGINFTWNLLDFGVSYLSAKQSADNYLIAKKTREKVMLTLLQEVRSAYWYAVAMEEMEDEFTELYEESLLALENLTVSREEGLGNPASVLAEFRTMLETIQVLEEIEQSINTSRTRLATLINVYSYETFELDVPEKLPKLYRISKDEASMEFMEQTALANSVDYLSEIYNVRIEQAETRKAMLQLLPGLEFSYGDEYSSNRFYLNNQWEQIGLNLTSDLMSLLNTNTIKKFRETSEQLTIGRKLAVNMATVAGVNITWQDYQNSGVAFERASLLEEVDAQIFQITQNQANIEQAVLGEGGFESLNNSTNQVQLIQGKLRVFMSKIGKMEKYAAAQTSSGAYMGSLGLNPIPSNYQDYSVDALGQYIADGFHNELQPFMALNAFDDVSVVYVESKTVSGNVLENDILKNESEVSLFENSSGDEVSVGVILTTNLNGSLIINKDGSYIYTLPSELPELDPNEEFKEIFQYTVIGSDGDLDIATLTIVAKPGLAPPLEILTEGPSLDSYLDSDNIYFIEVQNGLDRELREAQSIQEAQEAETAREAQSIQAAQEAEIAREALALQAAQEAEAAREALALQAAQEAEVAREALALQAAQEAEAAREALALQAEQEAQIAREAQEQALLIPQNGPNLDGYLNKDRAVTNSLDGGGSQSNEVEVLSGVGPAILEYQDAFISE